MLGDFISKMYSAVDLVMLFMILCHICIMVPHWEHMEKVHVMYAFVIVIGPYRGVALDTYVVNFKVH